MNASFKTPVCVIKYGFLSAFCLWVFAGICTVNESLDGHCVFLSHIIPVKGFFAFFDFARAALAICFSVSDFLKCWQCRSSLQSTRHWPVSLVLVMRYVTWLCCCILSNHSLASPSFFRLILTWDSKANPGAPGNVSSSFDWYDSTTYVYLSSVGKTACIFESSSCHVSGFRFGEREVWLDKPRAGSGSMCFDLQDFRSKSYSNSLSVL